MKTIATTISATLVLGALGVQSVQGADYLSAKCETALALSALPSHLRTHASVYALGPEGFTKTVDSDGPFTCIVERNHPKSVIPQCVDAAGVDVILPAIMHKTKLAMQGMDPADIRADFSARVDRGEFKAPSSLGVNYMMSSYNYIYLQGRDVIANIPPHLMHYAPNVTNEDIKAVPNAPRLGLPHINAQGIHGYFISFVEGASDPGAVQQACAGEVGDVPPEV